jgi:hypothetical protein
MALSGMSKHMIVGVNTRRVGDMLSPTSESCQCPEKIPVYKGAHDSQQKDVWHCLWTSKWKGALYEVTCLNGLCAACNLAALIALRNPIPAGKHCSSL